MARKSDPLAFGGLALLTLIWSFSWIAMKQVTSYIGAFDFTALRCIFGAVVQWIVMLIRGKALKPTPFGYTLAIALLQTCGMVGLAQWALMSGGAGKVAILSYTMPFWVVVMAALFLGERMRRWQYIAIGVACVGLILVLQPWQLDFTSLKSALLAILSGVSWGADAICRRSNERSGLARPATGGRLAARRFLGPGLQRNPCNGAGLESVAFCTA